MLDLVLILPVHVYTADHVLSAHAHKLLMTT